MRGDGLLDITFDKAHGHFGIELGHSVAAGTYVSKVLRGSHASRTQGLSKGVGVRCVNQVAVHNPEHAASMIRNATGVVSLRVTRDVVAQGQGWSIFQAPSA